MPELRGRRRGQAARFIRPPDVPAGYIVRRPNTTHLYVALQNPRGGPEAASYDALPRSTGWSGGLKASGPAFSICGGASG